MVDELEVPIKKYLPEQGLEIDLGAENMADIFGEYTESQFKVSKEEKKALWDEIQEEYAPSKGDIIKSLTSVGPETLSIYQTKLAKLKGKKLENKIDHISNVIGEKVDNVGFDNLKDMSMVFDLARSKYFVNRKKKFLDKFPNGSYVQVQVNFGNKKTENVELFKYDKGVEGWKLTSPYGRNFGEIGHVAGTILDEQLAGDIFGAIGPGKFLKVIPVTLRVAMGNWLGLKGKKLVEWIRSYGEGEFADAEELKDVNIGKLFSDLSDWGNAALAGGLFKVGSEIGNYLIRGKTPGMVEMSEQIIRASEALGLDPLVFGQLASNPIVRRIFLQAGEFVGLPPKIKQGQLESLKKSLQTFGIKDDKVIKEMIEKGVPHKGVSWQEVIDLQEHLALDIAEKMKMFNKAFPDPKSQKIALDKAVNEWSQVAIKMQTKLSNKVMKNVTDDSFVNLRSFRNAFGAQMKEFVKKTVKTVDRPIIKNGKVVGTKQVKVKGEYGDLPLEFQKIHKALNDILYVPKSMKSGDGIVKPGTLTALKDKKMEGLKTLFKMREDLHKLTMNKDRNISAAATELHQKLAKILNPENGNIGGSTEFLSSLKFLDSQVKGQEVVNSLKFIKEALGGAGDPDSFVKQFMHPGGPIKLQALKHILTSGSAGNKAQEKAGNHAFNILRKTWFSNILKNSDDEALTRWVAHDRDGLKLLLGDNYLGKVNEMRKIIHLTKRLEGGILNDLTKGSNKEVAQKIMKLSTEKGKPGLGMEFDEIIKDLGGVDGQAAEMVRVHIIKGMLDKAQKIVDKGPKMFSDTLDPRILRQEIKKLQKNDYLMKFFDDPAAIAAGKTSPMIEALQNYNLYTTALAGQSDVGGMIAAGEMAKKASEGIFNPKELTQIGYSLLKHDLMARILSNKSTSAAFKNLDLNNPTRIRNMNIFYAALAEISKDIIGATTGAGEPKDEGVIGEIPIDVIGKKDTDILNIPIKPADTRNLNLQSSMNVDRPVRDSRLGQFDMARVVGGGGGGGVDPNTMARGQQLFNKPGEITFAAQGGIMSTNKAFQRVA